MKTIITFICTALLLCTSYTSFAQLDLPSGSQKASVTQRVGTTNITINYSRPSVRAREIYGKLVPYGLNNLGFGTSKAAPWRAGADENTTITFEHAVKINDKSIPAGTYGLHLNIVDASNAKLILSTDKDAWGSYFYEPKNDVFNEYIEVKDIPHVETLTYVFDVVTPTSTTASLKWEKKAFDFKIEVDVTDIVLDDIRSQFKGQKGFTRLNWEQAANFALNNDGDLNEALTWINNALEGNFYSLKTVNGLAIKAQILKKQGDKAGFNATMDEAVTLATPIQINRMGFMMINEKDYDRAIRYFNINVKDDPKNANWYASLGAVYMAKGNKKAAIKNYKKALSLEPTARIKTNAEKNLKELMSK